MPTLTNSIWPSIDELEEIVAKFVKEECIEKVVVGNVIMLFLYTDNVVLFPSTLGDAQKLMKALVKIVCILN